MNKPVLEEIDRLLDHYKTSIPAPSEKLKLSITIPAADEEMFLDNALMALSNQVDNLGNEIDKDSYEVLVLCHNGKDKTAVVGREFQNKFPQLNLILMELNSDTIANLGSARRLLMELSCERLIDGRDFIITTDADTVVSKDWLHQTQVQKSNLDLICGKIAIDTTTISERAQSLFEAKDKYNALKARLHASILPDMNDPWPRHNHHSASSLAVRKDVYQKVGGMPPIDFLEDISFYNKVKGQGHKVRHDPEVKVTTSSRLKARTAMGLGSELNLWTNNLDFIYKVESLQQLKNRFNIYKIIQDKFELFQETDISEIQELSNLDEKSIRKIYSKSKRAEQMIIKIEKELDLNPDWNSKIPKIDIFKAIPEMEDYFENRTLGMSKE